MKATDKVFNQIIKNPIRLNVLPNFMRDQAMIESIKMGRKKLELGYPILPLKESKTKQEQFAKELNYNMITMKLNRAIM